MATKPKFNEAQREVIGTNCIAAIRYPGVKTRVAVYCGSDSAGAAVAGTIQSTYPSYKLYMAEDQGLSVAGHILMGIFTWGAGNLAMLAGQTWKNFTVETKSLNDSEKLVEEIGSCIDEYGGYEETSGLGTPDIPSIGTGGSGGTKAKNTTIYLIAGVVIAVVLAMVLTRKKKK